MRKFRFLSLAALSLALVVMASGQRSGIAQGMTHRDMDSGQTETVLPEVEAYAAFAGVSVSEAQYRLNLQGPVGALNERLNREYPDVFAGIYIRSQPTYGIVVLFTDSAPPEAIQFGDGELVEHIEVRTVNFSLVELEAVRTLAVAGVEAMGIPVQSGINVQGNVAEVYVAGANGMTNQEDSSVQQIRDYLQSLTPKSNEMIRAVEFESLSQHVDADAIATVRGGAKIWKTDGSRYCTAGFPVNNPWTGERGITTAGHCDDQLYYFKWTSFALVYEWGTSGGVYDIQWNSTQPTQNVVNEIDIGT